MKFEHGRGPAFPGLLTRHEVPAHRCCCSPLPPKSLESRDQAVIETRRFRHRPVEHRLAGFHALQ